MTSEPDFSSIVVPGLGIGGYRSMPDLRLFAPLGKVTLLAGQNNVGKSNVIRFLDRYMRQRAPMRGWEDEPRPSGGRLLLATAHRLDHEAYEQRVGEAKGRINRFLGLSPFKRTDDDLYWVVRSQADPQSGYGSDGTSRWIVDPDWIREFEALGEGSFLTTLKRGLFSSYGGHASENVIDVVNLLFPFEPPTVEVIHAFRRVVTGDADADHSGSNLIATLADHQNPDVRERHKEAKFEQINEFLRKVLEDQSVRIEIPANREYIAVHQGGIVLPLEDLGTGIHQVVIMAAAATLIDRSLVCIEEPEVNLHPILQRKFVRYLSEQTTNQYIIATHSAHMLDYERAAIVHLRKDDNGTQPSRATSTQHVVDVCTDLGYRPSDILQSNAIIWVEGPSDRIYLNHWLRLLDPSHRFIENIHYTVMFYGGSLRSHLSGEDPLDTETANDLISLRRVNRNSVIVIDSDRTRARASMDANKVRVRDEFNRGDLAGHAWVTSCRTIENYVPRLVLLAAVTESHPRLRYKPPATKWDDPLNALQEKAEKRAQVDKVKVAAAATARWDSSVPLEPDLRREVRRLLSFIATANPNVT